MCKRVVRDSVIQDQLPATGPGFPKPLLSQYCILWAAFKFKCVCRCGGCTWVLFIQCNCYSPNAFTFDSSLIGVASLTTTGGNAVAGTVVGIIIGIGICILLALILIVLVLKYKGRAKR